MKTLTVDNGITMHTANDFEGYAKEISKAMEVAVHEAETSEQSWFEQYRLRTEVAQAYANILDVVQKRLQELPATSHCEKIPLWEKFNLTIEEATVYFEIGEKKLRDIVNKHRNKDFFLKNGTKVLIKRVKFEQYLNSLNGGYEI